MALRMFVAPLRSSTGLPYAVAGPSRLQHPARASLQYTTSASRLVRPTLLPRCPPGSFQARLIPQAVGSARLASTYSPPPTLRNQLRRPMTILLIFVPIVTGILGFWQIKRLRWKVALIDEVERNLKKEPMILPSKINMEALPDFAFRRVLVKGTFTGPPILLGPQVLSGVPGGGSGWNLILPLQRSAPSSSSSSSSSSSFFSSFGSAPSSTPASQSTILVNRGFITADLANAIRAGTVEAPGIGEEAIVEGMIAKTDFGQGWAPDNKKEKNEWYWKDVAAMAEYVGGEEAGVQPVLVDVIDHGETPATLLMQQGTPVGRPAMVELRNQHASYAATWFSLSAATTVMLALMLRRGKKTPYRSRRDL